VTFDKEANDIDDFLIWIKEAANPEDIPLLQEWMGYCTYPDYPYHETLWIKGNGRNGKGVYDRSIQGLVGEENCCHIDLMNLNRRFGLKDFYHKLYYSNSEPASDKPFFTENWKRLSGGDTIEAEFKGFNEKKKFVSVAKPTIIGNKFPKVADNSIAFTDRMHFVTFSKYIPPKDRIPHLEKNWLGDKKKKSALFNWALEGLYRVIENNGFTVSKSQAETALEFQRATDPANAFINEMGIFDRSLLTTRSDLYHKLAEYCDGNGLELPTKAELTQAMQLQAPKVKDGSTRRGGKKERAWIGFAVKDLEQLEQLEHQLQPPKNKQVSLKKREKKMVFQMPQVFH
jgi:putative DNA primase/helicase